MKLANTHFSPMKGLYLLPTRFISTGGWRRFQHRGGDDEKVLQDEAKTRKEMANRTELDDRAC